MRHEGVLGRTALCCVVRGRLSRGPGVPPVQRPRGRAGPGLQDWGGEAV